MRRKERTVGANGVECEATKPIRAIAARSTEGMADDFSCAFNWLRHMEPPRIVPLDGELLADAYRWPRTKTANICEKCTLDLRLVGTPPSPPIDLMPAPAPLPALLLILLSGWANLGAGATPKSANGYFCRKTESAPAGSCWPASRQIVARRSGRGLYLGQDCVWNAHQLT